MRVLAGRRRIVMLALTVALASCNTVNRTMPPTAGAAPASAAAQSLMLPNGLSEVITSPGRVDGLDDQFHPHDGDTPSGGHGTIVDRKVPCLSTMPETYHVHVYLGIVYNGNLMAIPDAIGMVHPGPEIGGFVNSATCFYEIHTHDASGIVHIESQKPVPLTQSIYKLRNVLDVWGVPYGPKQFGPFHGPIHVFVGNVPLRTTGVTQYTAYTGPYQFIKLYSHEVIWLEIGKYYYQANQLPPVTFYMEY